MKFTLKIVTSFKQFSHDERIVKMIIIVGEIRSKDSEKNMIQTQNN